MFAVFAVFLAAVLVSETKAITCHYCEHLFDPTNCTKVTNDKTGVCVASVKTCVIGTGLRPERKESGRLIPAMTRRCSEPNENGHVERWNAASASGHKMICYMQQSEGYVDRTCVCGEDSCNKHIWDEVMVQPVLEVNQSVTGIPIFPTLGVNALDKILSGPSPTVSLKPSETSTTFLMPNKSATPATLLSSTSIQKSPEKDGLGTGPLVGLTVGGLLLLGLIGFGIYWFKLRKRTERGSGDTGTSDGSADTEASGDDD